MDRSFRDEPADARPTVSTRDFVLEKDPFFTARRAIPSREPGVAVRVGADVTRGEAHAEYVGMLRLSAAGAETVRGLLDELAAEGWDRPFHGAPSVREAGLPHLRFHDLRHACATLLLAQGVHPRVVMEILGHSQIAMTMDVYSHVFPELQEHAASEMEALLTG